MTKQTRSRILVIGGGAGGLAAAAAAGEAGADVTILERSDRVGKKILRTGNGRCNLSNLHISPEAYNRPEFVKPLREKTGCAELLDFFASIGLWTVSDGEGRVYPRSDTASSVLDVLRLAAAERGGKELCSAQALSIRLRDRGGFIVKTAERGDISADKVIVATGGGTDLLGPLGFSRIPFQPVLCPLRTDTGPIRGLSGLRVRCRAALIRGGKEIAAETGEILFRDFGVSGIPALDLSRFARRGDTLALDLMPELSGEDLHARLAGRDFPGRDARERMTGTFHRRVIEALLRSAGEDSAAALTKTIKDFRLAVQGPGDERSAQVTRGGADPKQFDPLTLESRRVPGLYCIGEALDIDGRCGGYNLHWAFASGLAAGRSAST